MIVPAELSLRSSYSTVPESISRLVTWVRVSPPLSSNVPLLITAAAEENEKLDPSSANKQPELMVRDVIWTAVVNARVVALPPIVILPRSCLVALLSARLPVPSKVKA